MQRQAEPKKLDEPSKLEKEIVSAIVTMNIPAISSYRPKKNLGRAFKKYKNKEIKLALVSLRERDVVDLKLDYEFDWRWKRRCGYVVNKVEAGKFCAAYPVGENDTDIPEEFLEALDK